MNINELRVWFHIYFYFSRERVKLYLIVKDISLFKKNPNKQQKKPLNPPILRLSIHMRQPSGVKSSYSLSVAL